MFQKEMVQERKGKGNPQINHTVKYFSNNLIKQSTEQRDLVVRKFIRRQNGWCMKDMKVEAN
jgi:hypothetical protein